ncbi:aspartate aminotransferase family protein [Bradyrhizobium vignae]|uniref:Uncharacterized aminotransferase y4qG n=1 Tax=Bradyrhizobium vignae TaxID=1549949 RepID=A0A2U3PUR5_9BRAD|nr:aspartate aminotransferase family protein [Bradyrhizobium vignae]SPP92874.1 Uncharacterized aminotransferase y4qG [Bradyrhizobium vignae]
MDLSAFTDIESEVRYYCRRLPNLLASAKGAIIRDVDGNEFIDFLSACGALNYGHNHPALKMAAMEYLASDGIVAGLDFHTSAKLAFIEGFRDFILRPRGLDYKLQFPGPTGTNCVEAAVKLARKVTGRSSVVAFTNAFHGMSAGALALTGSRKARQATSAVLHGAVRVPFDGYKGAGSGDLERLVAMANDPSGGIDPIAAIIIETVQGEGGLNVASDDWLRMLHQAAKALGALLIVDDIQAGCGRTGTFFSFERAGLVPDVVCMAKSISGLGLPMSLLLMKPEHDVWEAGEHNGTFRGNSLAFVTGKAALELWRNGELAEVPRHGHVLSSWTAEMARRYGESLRPKGLGMMQGIEFAAPHFAGAVAEAAVRRGVVVECCGPHDEVLKLMPPLNIGSETLEDGLGRIAEAIREVIPSSVSFSKRYESHPDAHYHGGNAVVGPELAHAVA